ncbi:MAG: hypothetical protein ABI885_16795, partial [Gammaproteobacteria bacterium]
MSVSTVGSVIARGAQSAHAMNRAAMAEENPPGAFDVWSASHDGVAAGMKAAAGNPAGFLAGSPSEFARAQAASLNTSTTASNRIENSMMAQASALGGNVSGIGEAQGVLPTVGATFATLTGVEQMLSSVLSAIPFPAFPAVRIADFDIGLPHAHAHPPNLIPPAPPIPLPSMGPVIPIPILSGASNTLINGRPA